MLLIHQKLRRYDVGSASFEVEESDAEGTGHSE
jgi:hypothetical protein